MLQERCRTAVNAVKYPPNGNRGVGLARVQNYGLGFEEYKIIKKDSVVIAQIEHKEAVKNIKDIIQVDGIDGIIIGPYDMSASFGIPGEIRLSYSFRCHKADRAGM